MYKVCRYLHTQSYDNQLSGIHPDRLSAERLQFKQNDVVWRMGRIEYEPTQLSTSCAWSSLVAAPRTTVRSIKLDSVRVKRPYNLVEQSGLLLYFLMRIGQGLASLAGDYDGCSNVRCIHSVLF